MKKVRASAARIPQAKPHVSANAFKVIPTASVIQSHQEQATEDSVNPDEEPEEENDQNASDVSASNFRKRSHSELRSSSPVAHSLRSSSPVTRSSSPVAHSLRSSSPIIPPKKKVKTGPQPTPALRTIPVYREGAEVKHKKPKASDYEDIVQALILRAASQYEASVSTQDSFPDTTLRLKWARKSWNDANNDAGHKYEITDEISSLVNISNLILLILVTQIIFSSFANVVQGFAGMR